MLRGQSQWGRQLYDRRSSNKEEMLTDLVDARIDETCCCFKTFVVDVGGLFGDIVGSTELDVGLFEVVFDSGGLYLSSSLVKD